eukprot:g3064.t1
MQLFRWAKSEVEPNGIFSFGAPINIEPILKTPDNEEDGLWGFNASILREGETVCQVGVWMDREQVEKYEFVGIGEDRFPVNEGRVTIIDGKALEIWKIGDNEIDDDTRSVVRSFCKALSEAIDSYASFGSCFADDAT